jgi:hypothetical protein
MKTLPKSLQKAIVQALGKEEHFSSHTSEAPPVPPVPAGSSSSWPGYLWYLGHAAPATLMDIVRSPNWYSLSPEERALVRARLNWSVEDVMAWREKSARLP